VKPVQDARGRKRLDQSRFEACERCERAQKIEGERTDRVELIRSEDLGDLAELVKVVVSMELIRCGLTREGVNDANRRPGKRLRVGN
jgi:hypothetical protein